MKSLLAIFGSFKLGLAARILGDAGHHKLQRHVSTL
jgi:hypothetical protein